MKTHRSGIALLLAASLAACGGEQSRWAGTITDSAGVTIVSNPGDGIWSEAERWTVKEELRIGVVEGDPHYQFGDIGGIAVDSRGRIFVLDVQEQHIEVFSPEGEYEQTIGGPGGGPGELAAAYFAPVMGAGDTLSVPDVRGNRRINRYAPDGSSIGSYPIPFEMEVALLFKSSPSGAAVAWVRPFAYPGQPEPDKIDKIVVLSSDETIPDTLLTFPSGETFTQGGPSFRLVIHAPEPVWEITQDSRLLFCVNDQYRLGLYASGGKLERVIAKPVERKPITDSDKELYLRPIPPGVRELIRFAEFYPAFNDVFAGPNGTTWVQHVRTLSELNDAEREAIARTGRVQRIVSTLRKFGGTADWDVFDSEGRYLGVVTMPLRIASPLVRGDNIYGVWRDELDVQYVVRLRIVGDLGAGAT
jgi:hypothetical protein